MSDTTRIAVLISGRGSNLQTIIDACAAGQLAAEICIVISNVAAAKGLQRATQAGLNTTVIEHDDYPSREQFDQAITNRLLECGIQWVVLAGFMRILSDEFVNRWRGQLINIHPSLLPRYQGLYTHKRALAAGDKQAGASVHFVTQQLDDGPVILQGVVDVEPDDTEGTLSTRVLAIEHIIYPMALQWLIEGRLTLRDNSCELNGKPIVVPPKWYQDSLAIGQ